MFLIHTNVMLKNIEKKCNFLVSYDSQQQSVTWYPHKITQSRPPKSPPTLTSHILNIIKSIKLTWFSGMLSALSRLNKTKVYTVKIVIKSYTNVCIYKYTLKDNWRGCYLPSVSLDISTGNNKYPNNRRVIHKRLAYLATRFSQMFTFLIVSILFCLNLRHLRIFYCLLPN